MTSVLKTGGNLDTDMHRGRPCEDTGGRPSSTSQGEKPQKKPTLPTPDLKIPASRLWENRFLLFRPPLCATLYGSPSRLTQRSKSSITEANQPMEKFHSNMPPSNLSLGGTRHENWIEKHWWPHRRQQKDIHASQTGLHDASPNVTAFPDSAASPLRKQASAVTDALHPQPTWALSHGILSLPFPSHLPPRQPFRLVSALFKEHAFPRTPGAWKGSLQSTWECRNSAIW